MPNFGVMACVGPAAGRRTYTHTYIHTHFHLYIGDSALSYIIALPKGVCRQLLSLSNNLYSFITTFASKFIVFSIQALLHLLDNDRPDPGCDSILVLVRLCAGRRGTLLGQRLHPD
jgi:hypothetical protein